MRRNLKPVKTYRSKRGCDDGYAISVEDWRQRAEDTVTKISKDMDKHVGWAFIQIMGHIQIAGHLKLRDFGGVSMWAVEIPKTDNAEAFEGLYSPEAMFGFTLITKDEAQRIANNLDLRQINKWLMRETSPVLEVVKSSGELDDIPG